MRLSDIPIGDDYPNVVNAVVEIPKGSSNKYEYSFILDSFVLDRVLYSPLYYPTDYGWIAGTISPDGDPLDILIFTSHPTFSGCIIRTRPVGVLHMHDEEGKDFKILGVADTDPRYDRVHSLDDLPEHVLKEIVHFFSVYKQLENKETEILGWLGPETAHRIIRESVKREQAIHTHQQ
jgi:inorganic pyrophosphatase